MGWFSAFPSFDLKFHFLRSDLYFLASKFYGCFPHFYGFIALKKTSLMYISGPWGETKLGTCFQSVILPQRSGVIFLNDKLTMFNFFFNERILFIPPHPSLKVSIFIYKGILAYISVRYYWPSCSGNLPCPVFGMVITVRILPLIWGTTCEHPNEAFLNRGFCMVLQLPGMVLQRRYGEGMFSRWRPEHDV